MSHKKSEADLRLEYPYALEKAIVIALAIHLLAFLTFPAMKVKPYQRMKKQEIIKVENIPETQQFKRPPPPARPSIPIETESEEIPEDITIEDTDLDLTETPPPPPPMPEIVDFYALDKRPELIMSSYVEPIYPEIARRAEVEGNVILKLLLDEEGNVIDTEVLKEDGNVGLAEAAIAAVMQWKFSPAYQRDKPVRVWVSQVVRFTLD